MFATLFEIPFEFRILSGRSLLAEPQKIPPQFESLNRAHPVCLLDVEACPRMCPTSLCFLLSRLFPGFKNKKFLLFLKS